MNWNLSMDKLVAGTMGGVLLPVFEFFYGPGTAVYSVMIALALIIVMDWISGSRAAKKDNTYGSRYGIDGIFRTLFMVCLPAVGHLLDIVFSLPGILFGIFAVGLIYHTLNSMTANAIRAGWGDWLPIDALDLVTQWVDSEIKSKVFRAKERLDKRDGKAGM